MDGGTELLIPLDGKPHSQRAVDLVLRLFRLDGQKVVLLHVVEDLAPSVLLADGSGRLEDAYFQASYTAAESLLESVSAPLAQAGAMVEARVARGRPQGEILSAVAAGGVPLIIMSPGDHDARDLLLHGSVVSSLMRFDFDGMLVLARTAPAKEDLPEVVFVMDGSAEAVSAVRLVAPLVRPELPLVLVASGCGYGSAAMGQPGGDSSASFPAAALEAEEQSLRSRGHAARGLMLEQSFEDWIAEAAGDATWGLMVLPRTRESVLHRPLTGTPAERICLSQEFSTALYCSKINR